jgi:hypothetical protein
VKEFNVVEVSATGDDAERVLDAGREIDDNVVGSEQQLVEDNPILVTMARIANEHNVSVTLSVYPPSDDNELVDEDGKPVDDD